MDDLKLFEFDIAWDQAINYAFDQDDVKTVGKARVESDSVRVIAPDREMAELALKRSFQHRNMTVRTPVRELPIHLTVDFKAKSITSVQVTRRVGPEELSEWGKKAVEHDRKFY